MTDLINRTHGTDGDGDGAPGSPDAPSSTQSGPVATDAVAQDAHAQDAAKTNAAETDAGADSRKKSTTPAIRPETTDDAPSKSARTVRTPAAAKLATAEPKPGASKNGTAKSGAAKSSAPSKAGVASKTETLSKTGVTSRTGTPKAPESKASADKADDGTKSPVEQAPRAKRPTPKSSSTRTPSANATVTKAAVAEATGAKALGPTTAASKRAGSAAPATKAATARKPAAKKPAAQVPAPSTAKTEATGTTVTTGRTGATTARPKRPTQVKSASTNATTSATKQKPVTKAKPAPTDAGSVPDSRSDTGPQPSTDAATSSAIEPDAAVPGTALPDTTLPDTALPDAALTDAAAASAENAPGAAPSPASAGMSIGETAGASSAALLVEPSTTPSEPATPSAIPAEKTPKNAPASAPRATPAALKAPASVAKRDPRSASLKRAVDRTAHSLVYLLPLLAIAAVIQVVNLAGSPARIAEEGTNTAQAWSVLKLGELVRDANWFDHPPLGWLQISGYAGLTGAFDRYDLAVLAAREAMVAFALVSVLLVWVLARRLRLTRPAAAGAVLLFALSPLALQLHRTVYLDNVAVPWLLGAFVLATLRRYQLVAFAGSAVAFSVAMLSGETALLALPFLAWVMWRSSDSETRLYTLPTAGAIVVVSGLAYVLYGSSNGGLTQAPGSGGLLGSLIFPFAASLSNASLADPGATTAGTLSTWWQLDPVLLVSGVVAAIAALFLTRLRPIAAFVVFSALLVLMPGAATPASYAIVLLPFIALLIAGVVEEAVILVRSRERSYWLRMADRGIGGVILAGAVAAIVIAAPAAVSQIRGFLAGDADRPARQAEQWLTDNVPSNARVIVDDSSWVDLVAAGFSPDRVDGYDPTDAGASAPEQVFGTARPADYVVAPASSGAIPAGLSQVRRAVANSVSVVRFGSGDRAVEVRRIETVDPTAARATETALTQKRARAGAELLANPALTVSTGARGVIAGGNLDGRLIVLLGQLAASGDVAVTSAPTGLTETTNVRRMVTLTTGSAAGDAELLASLKAMTGTYAPDASAVPSGLRLTVSADEPDVFG
ncbi:hypothetical protein E6C70_12695 [Glaciibacter flavus]|uniref:Glycosyltransferase RgtA/B/C/D-like domain-containing protein n=1 Tax=Orlajensenia flava TaxID=2565934 RepID=A0A4S4FQM8_9MICO|nr:hypothetical protein [Glaciibacter flavus]THG32601.1 hypothetical protein E6C70_12695 [Glaciibacter flavus]